MIHRWYDAALAFLKRHERPLASILFVTGFIGDLATFGLMDLPAVTLLFAAYLALAVIATVIAQITCGHQGKLGHSVAVLMPLLAQFVFGSIFSGFLIFYAKGAVLSVSWPFIILLACIFFGNEVFRNYREQLIFQTVLVYFSLYAFIIFAVPLYLSRLGRGVFIESTALAIAGFALYLAVLGWFGWPRLRSTLRAIIGITAVLTALIVGSYLTGFIPPLPLTLKDGGIYQSIVRESDSYVVQGEKQRLWWDPRAQEVHHIPGTPLYAYSAIFAPGKFTAGIVHVWQRYDPAAKAWVTRSTVAFTLSGGRAAGYRGYSLKADPEPGSWRVLVQTADRQTIGKFTFTVENTGTVPALTTQTL